MATLFDVITFSRKKYTELSDDQAARDLIREIARKLSALEFEIMNYPEGEIEIKPSGAVDVLEFPDYLIQKIQQHIK